MAALIPQTEPAEDDGKMGTEIERKFTVVGDTWRPSARSVQIVQGYMTRDPRRVVRIRTMDNRGSITLKGISRGAARTEFEYEIPAADAHQMLNELEPFTVINPSAENLAEHFYERLSDELKGLTGVRVKEVKIWETAIQSATFRPTFQL